MCPLQFESVKTRLMIFLLFFFGGACLCVIYCTEYYQAELHST